MADRSIVYRITADVSQLKAQMAVASAAVKDAGDKMTASTKEGAKFRDGLGTLGVAAGRIGLVAAAGLGAAVVKAANFDQAMSNVQAATHETAGNMQLLREAALKAGADTAFSATEAAAGIEALSKAGVSTADVLSGGLRGALDLAAAGNQSVGEAAETAATAMTQFGLSGEQIPHIADLLAAGAGKAQGEVSDLAAALNQAGLVASQTGLSIEDATGTLAAFASAGLTGSDAGTSFKSMLQRLQNPIGAGAKAMATLGINAYDAQGNFVGIANVAGQLQDKLGGLTQAQRDAALAQIFGSDAVRAASVLYQQGASGIQEWINKTNDAGYAAETAETKLDNLKGDLEALGGALETALIGTGSGTQGPLRSMVQGITDVVNAYNKLPGAAQSGVGAILGVTAAAGGGLYAFSKIVQGVANTREAMENLGLSMDAVRSKSGSTATSLGSIGIQAAGIIGAVALVDQLTDSLNRVDASKIDRGLQAVSRGEITEDIKLVVGDLVSLESRLGSVRTAIDKVLPGSGPADKQAENIAQVDDALASMVEGGNIDQARASFSALADAAGEQGIKVGALRDRFPEYQTALENAGVATNVLQGASNAVVGALTSATSATSANSAAAAENAKAQQAMVQAATETANSFRGLGDSLNDSKVSLSDWMQEMAAQNQALADFTSNAEKASRRGLAEGLIDQLREAGPEGAMRLKQLANATDAEIARMNRIFRRGERGVQAYVDSTMGITAALRRLPKEVVTDMRTNGVPRTRAQIVDLTAKYNLTPKQVATLIRETGGKPTKAMVEGIIAKAKELQRQDPSIKIRASDGASGVIAAVRGRLVALNGYVATTYVRTVGIGAQTRRALADGGTVHGAREPYGDKVLTYLAPGEEVTSNRYGQADRYRQVLRAINADLPPLTIKAMLADGGTVPGAQSLAGGGTVERRVRRDRDDDKKDRDEKKKGTKETKAHTAALKKNRDALARERKARDDLVNKRNDLASTLRDSFRSDLFASSDVWAAGGGNPLEKLRADIAKASAFQAQVVKLRAGGVTGDALAAIASTGNIGAASSLASMSAADLKTYQSLFKQRAQVTSAVGSYAGAAAYGSEIAALNKNVAQLVAATKRREKNRKRDDKKRAKDTGKEVAKGVNKGASRGPRKNRGR